MRAFGLAVLLALLLISAPVTRVEGAKRKPAQQARPLRLAALHRTDVPTGYASPRVLLYRSVIKPMALRLDGSLKPWQRRQVYCYTPPSFAQEGMVETMMQSLETKVYAESTQVCAYRFHWPGAAHRAFLAGSDPIRASLKIGQARRIQTRRLGSESVGLTVGAGATTTYLLAFRYATAVVLINSKTYDNTQAISSTYIDPMKVRPLRRWLSSAHLVRLARLIERRLHYPTKKRKAKQHSAV